MFLSRVQVMREFRERLRKVKKVKDACQLHKIWNLEWKYTQETVKLINNLEKL